MRYTTLLWLACVLRLLKWDLLEIHPHLPRSGVAQVRSIFLLQLSCNTSLWSVSVSPLTGCLIHFPFQKIPVSCSQLFRSQMSSDFQEGLAFCWMLIGFHRVFNQYKAEAISAPPELLMLPSFGWQMLSFLSILHELHHFWPCILTGTLIFMASDPLWVCFQIDFCAILQCWWWMDPVGCHVGTPQSYSVLSSVLIVTK